jgi:hypothetical protein
MLVTRCSRFAHARKAAQEEADPSQGSGFRLQAHARKAAQEEADPSQGSGFRLQAHARKAAQEEADPSQARDFACGLTPAKRLNLTKLFAIFLHKLDVF